MSRRQRHDLDALLRSAPKTAYATVEEARASFDRMFDAPAPDGVTVREGALAGRPALEIEAGDRAGDTVVLYLHGGGYVVGSPRTHAALAGELTRRARTRLVSLDYRLAPEHPFPAAVEDALAAYRELLERGARPAGIALAGDSAGGGLAIATLLAAREAGLPMPAAAVLFSPWADLTLTGDSMETKQGLDPIFDRSDIEGYRAHYLGARDPSAPTASPALADLTGLPPLLVQAGSNELLLDDAVRLAARAAADGVDVTLRVWGGLPHVFQHQYGSVEEAGQALDDAVSFLSRAHAAAAAEDLVS
ncbi:alpha/beta hydrolase [Actinomadura sp. ATCC 31491]|uniref:Alpha/beta hydrolase n=1 Tax=Actinomadura luzonensis TaxID=2805427 RepID=A0ABT0G386_9ACTN|nr:alpha/beta hydrolase [Actinomadura luzonensis]MCK2218593.1 alpha/beta hydrolase [Actinomadura luzonensis]